MSFIDHFRAILFAQLEKCTVTRNAPKPKGMLLSEQHDNDDYFVLSPSTQ